MSILEVKTTELEDAGIKTVRINDKKSAKAFGILSSPGLTYFKGGKGMYVKDGPDTQKVLRFLTASNPNCLWVH